MNNIQDIHQLSLIFMLSFDLNIIHSIKWNINSSVFLDPFLQLGFVLSFNFNELVNKVFVSRIAFQLHQVVERSNPLIDSSKCITNQSRQFWVATMDPSSWGYTICFVLKFPWVQLIKLFKDGGFQKFSMECCNTIDGMRANN